MTKQNVTTTVTNHTLAKTLMQNLIQFGQLCDYDIDIEMLADYLTKRNLATFEAWDKETHFVQPWHQLIAELKTRETIDDDTEQNLYTLLSISSYPHKQQLWETLNNIDWASKEPLEFDVDNDNMIEVNLYISWAWQCEKLLQEALQTKDKAS